MSGWASRVPVPRVAGVMAAARRAGAWTADSKAVLFHDLDRLGSHLAQLRTALPDDALHAVAVKANPVVAVLREVVAAGCGLEAASWEEVALAVAAGCPPDRIVFDGPAKTDTELRDALALGVWLNADNAAELERLEALGAPGRARIGIRVNPGVGAGRIGITSTVGKASKFGVPLADAPALIRRYPFVTGLHVHTGSQGCGLDLLSAAARATAEVAVALDLAWLDVGGGLPVRYTASDPEPPPVSAWADALRDTPAWGRLRLLTELGRSVHAGCGFAVSRIETVKTMEGRPLLTVHLGADFLLRRVYAASDWDHELVVLDPDGVPREGPCVASSVGGPLCFAGDLIARNRPLPRAQPGDLLLIRDVGAYTLSMWSRHCSRGLPPVWGVRGEETVPLLAGETADDVVAFWSRGVTRG